MISKKYHISNSHFGKCLSQYVKAYYGIHKLDRCRNGSKHYYKNVYLYQPNTEFSLLQRFNRFGIADVCKQLKICNSGLFGNEPSKIYEKVREVISDDALRNVSQ